MKTAKSVHLVRSAYGAGEFAICGLPTKGMNGRTTKLVTKTTCKMCVKKTDDRLKKVEKILESGRVP